MRALRPHQQLALEYCRKNSMAALFMEMRLGKTKVVIERFRDFNKRILVVAPITTLRKSWEEELELEGETSRALLLGDRIERWKQLARHQKWNLINYEGLLAFGDSLLKRSWGAVVVDESVKIKNGKAQVSRFLAENFRGAESRIILTGKPAPEGPLNYYQQFKFLNGQFMGCYNFWAFRNKYFTPDAFGFRWIPKPEYAERLRAEVAENSFILSRKDVNLANEKIYEVREIEPDPQQRQLMKQVEDEFSLETEQTKSALQRFQWLCQLAGGFVDKELRFPRKANELLELLRGELKDESVVVWFNYNREMDAVYRILFKEGISVAQLNGEVREERRWEILDQFQKRKKLVLLCQLKLGQYGLDLSIASTAIYYSSVYSLNDRKQSEDRIENFNKKEPLLIIDLVTKNSIDEDILLTRKLKNINSDYYLRSEIIKNMRRRAE